MKETKIKSIVKKSYHAKVYNIEVKDNHNYFANGILVSNCHEGSGPDGNQGDLNLSFFKTLRPGTELACLGESSVVFGEHGAIEVGDLKVGDKIFDSEHVLRTVTAKAVSIKKPGLLKTSKGFRTTCSADHPFIHNGKETAAADLKLKDELACLLPQGHSKAEPWPIIDLAANLPEHGSMKEENEVRLGGSCALLCPRYLQTTPELAWLYGLFVAEGAREALSLNIKELDTLAAKAVHIWKTLNEKAHCRIDISKAQTGIQVSLLPYSFVRTLFLNCFKVGRGARHKTLEYLFTIENKEFIRQALLGLFQGDGCLRFRTTKYGTANSMLSLKTSSKKLAYEVVYLLARHFGIYASISHFWQNSHRPISGRDLPLTDAYMVEVYGNDYVNALFPELLTSAKYKSRKHNKLKAWQFIYPDAPLDEKLYDITLDSGTHVFPVNGYILTHNCGGGNALEHPGLDAFLERMKKQGVVCNMTVNQIHFLQSCDRIKRLADGGLIKGLGLSLAIPTDSFIEKAKEFENAVIHVIAGLFSEFDFEKLKGKGLKLLILGYKDFRRGHLYKEKFGEGIDKNIEWLSNHLAEVTGGFEVVSFDNLALEQLDVKSKVSKDYWERHYMGDDGGFTFYIDCVRKEFAKSSTEPLESRRPIMDSADEMFQAVLHAGKDRALA